MNFGRVSTQNPLTKIHALTKIILFKTMVFQKYKHLRLRGGAQLSLEMAKFREKNNLKIMRVVVYPSFQKLRKRHYRNPRIT